MANPSTSGRTPSLESGEGGAGAERNSHPIIGIRRSGRPAPRPLVAAGWSLATESFGGIPRNIACFCVARNGKPTEGGCKQRGVGEKFRRAGILPGCHVPASIKRLYFVPIADKNPSISGP